MDWLPSLLPTVIAICLAFYGWRIISRIANRRESYDICSSLIDMLERVEKETNNAWGLGIEILDRYTEQKLAALTSGIELRLKILQKHYHPTRINRIQLKNLRRFATTPKDLFHKDEDRGLDMHALVTDMVTILLEDNYDFINAVKKST